MFCEVFSCVMVLIWVLGRLLRRFYPTVVVRECVVMFTEGASFLLVIFSLKKETNSTVAFSNEKNNNSNQMKRPTNN